MQKCQAQDMNGMMKLPMKCTCNMLNILSSATSCATAVRLDSEVRNSERPFVASRTSVRHGGQGVALRCSNRASTRNSRVFTAANLCVVKQFQKSPLSSKSLQSIFRSKGFLSTLSIKFVECSQQWMRPSPVVHQFDGNGLTL